MSNVFINFRLVERFVRVVDCLEVGLCLLIFFCGFGIFKRRCRFNRKYKILFFFFKSMGGCVMEGD